LATSGRYWVFDPVVRANACPEIATSVMIDAVKAKFFIIVPFLAVSESPMA
jgi:hypothetical protein